MIVTVRVTSEARRRNLTCVLDWYQKMAGWEIVVVEQDHAPHLDSTDWPYAIKRLYVVNPGPFNKCWGFNVGVRAAQSEVLFFCDADVLLDHSGLKSAASLCAMRALAVKPYDRLIDLNADDTEALLSGAAGDFDRSDASALRGERERLCFCGGAFFMRRNLYHAMGGFDERYLGWGAEDDAMTLRMQRLTADVAMMEGRAAIHLWHERNDASTFGNLHYPDNLGMLKRLATLTDDGLRFQCDLQRQIMGHPGKYEWAAAANPV